ncbi:MAG: carbohydrate-binding domain-containing protein, partial [Ruminiclostridium sp.]|nr:carbohydrate-binding domain-containing protein [Ruminiclostridium sp.]
GIDWDSATSTLTLTNAAILVPDGSGIDIYGNSQDNLTIELVGSSTVIGGESDNGYLGMESGTGLTLRCGTTGGSLTATGDGSGIFASGNVTISGGAVVTATGKRSDGIGTYGNLTVRGEGTDVTAAGGWMGIDLGWSGTNTVTIEDGAEVTAKSERSDGIFTNSGNITISGAVVAATSEQRNGICTYSGSVIIQGEGTVVTAVGGSYIGENNTDYYDGIFANEDVLIADRAEVTVTGTRDGISVGGDVTISGGAVVTATGENAHGIAADNALTIDGTDTVVTAEGNGPKEDGGGIYSWEDIQISGGTVTASGANWGICAAELNYDSSDVLFVDKYITVTGGRVIASSTQGQAIGGILQTALPVWEGDDAATARLSTVDYSQGAAAEAKFVSVNAEPTLPTPPPV